MPPYSAARHARTRTAPPYLISATSRVHADFLLFFLSSTSVNSASTIFSLPDSGAAADGFCDCAYTASPSLVATCCSALAFVVISVASLPFKASRRSAMAFSIARRSLSDSLAPCSATIFSVACKIASA